MALVQTGLFATGSDVIEKAARSACGRGIDPRIAAECASSAARRFEALLGSELSTAQESRVLAYFTGAVRRQVMRSRGTLLREQRQRMVALTLAEDLARHGASPERIAHEVTEACGSEVDPREVVARALSAPRLAS